MCACVHVYMWIMGCYILFVYILAEYCWATYHVQLTQRKSNKNSWLCITIINVVTEAIRGSFLIWKLVNVYVRKKTKKKVGAGSRMCMRWIRILSWRIYDTLLFSIQLYLKRSKSVMWIREIQFHGNCKLAMQVFQQIVRVFVYFHLPIKNWFGN